jgi:hypothetical protein
MNLFAKFFGGKAKQSEAEQAVIVHLDAHGLPDEVYKEHDLATLEEQLEQAINAAQAGDLDGNEFRLSSLRGQKVVLVSWAPY